MPCCRMERPGWLERDKNEPPLCRVAAHEVYRFLYTHAFGQHASIRIEKRRDEITVERSYYSGTFAEAERFTALLTDRLGSASGCLGDGRFLVVASLGAPARHLSRRLPPDRRGQARRAVPRISVSPPRTWRSIGSWGGLAFDLGRLRPGGPVGIEARAWRSR